MNNKTGSDPWEPEMQRLFEKLQEWNGRPLHKWHHYFAAYEIHLHHFRARPITFLEIGLGGGGSLEMWRQYLGPTAKIIGLDNRPECSAFAGAGTEIFIGDQADRQFLDEVVSEVGVLDAVVDDGGHTATQQIGTFEAIYPQLRPGGVYIVEDTQTSYWSNFKDRPDGLTFMEHAKSLCDVLHAWHHDFANFARYMLPLALRQGAVEVPWFTRNTRSITFRDGMVIFERGDILEPSHSIRPIETQP